MNTAFAIILTVVVTNWTHIGDFRDNAGRTFDVQEGKIFTNTVSDVIWSEHFKFTQEDLEKPDIIFFKGLLRTNRFVLKSVPGPIVDERKAVLISNIFVTNITWFYNGTRIEPNQIPYPAIVTITNKPMPYTFTNLFLYNRGKKTHAIPAIKLEE